MLLTGFYTMGILVAKGLMVLVNVNSVRSPEKVVQLGIIPAIFLFLEAWGGGA